ncbi:MAG TPA: aminotransferase class I/II-fold pyridoxal phosphate-dependent enzyme [Natronosporangium sp.]|nr:aminotransferase class I/II-fold pyridoxal phosphate-dependent enzyme [Natronosporangium sp.]
MTEQYQITGRSAAAIAASVETGVRTGALPGGAPLPSVRGLASSLGVSPATVAAAYRTLRQRGVIETAGRRGTRVRPRPAVASLRTSRQPLPTAGLRNLSTGEPDPRLLPELTTHLRRVADSAAGGLPAPYPHAPVLPELAEEAGRRLRADQVPVIDRADPAAPGIWLTHGALDGIERVLTVHLRPGDRVAVEDPGWVNLLDLLAVLDLSPVPVPVDDEGPTEAGLAAALTAGVQAVVVTSRAQNPTGAAVGRERAAALRELLRRYPEVLLIEDDHAAEIAGVPLTPLVGTTRHWAFIRSASKPYGPDLRLAVVAGDPETLARVEGRMRIGAGWVSTMLQRVVLSLWRDPAVARTVAQAAETYRRRREGLRRELALRGVAAAGRTGINVWVPVPDETRAVAGLQEAGYVVAPGALYRIASGPAIRITLSGLSESDLPELAEAVAAAAGPPATARITR